MPSTNKASATCDARSAGPRAAVLALIVLAVGATVLVMANPARGDDVPSAAKADDDTQPAAELSRRDERRRRKAADADATQAENNATPIRLPAHPDAQVVCRTYRPLGSRIDQRVCATAAEWAARDTQGEKDADQFTREMRERASIPPPPDVTPGRTPL